MTLSPDQLDNMTLSHGQFDINMMLSHDHLYSKMMLSPDQ